jgi:hypothetical protein
VLRARILPPVEFKWKGLNVTMITIPPSSTRPLDAFLHHMKNPISILYILVSIIVALTQLGSESYMIERQDTFELNFILFSINFYTMRQTFLLDVGSKLDEIKFRKKEEE